MWTPCCAAVMALLYTCCSRWRCWLLQVRAAVMAPGVLGLQPAWGQAQAPVMFN